MFLKAYSGVGPIVRTAIGQRRALIGKVRAAPSLAETCSPLAFALELQFCSLARLRCDIPEVRIYCLLLAAANLFSDWIGRAVAARAS